MNNHVDNFNLGGALSSAASGDVGGLIDSVFGQTPGRKRQIFIRELCAQVNGYSSYNSWHSAGEPWFRETLLEFHTKADAAYPGFIPALQPGELDKYPSMNSGYKGINYELKTNLDQFPSGTMPKGSNSNPLTNVLNNLPNDDGDNTLTIVGIVAGVVVLIALIWYVSSNKKK